MNKPSVFIGSSVEGLDVARIVQAALQYNCEPTVWDQGIFKLTRSALSSLFSALNDYEYAIFIFSPDDVLRLRGVEYDVVRDNVIFELGLFLGKNGPDAVFVVQPRNSDGVFHLPSDLIGITTASYDSERTDENLTAALGPPCSEILRAISSASKSKYPDKLLKELAEIHDRYRNLLLRKIPELDLPDGFPMPESIDTLELRELIDLQRLLIEPEYFYSNLIHNPASSSGHCAFIALDKGEASPIENYKFKKELEEYRNIVMQWEKA